VASLVVIPPVKSARSGSSALGGNMGLEEQTVEFTVKELLQRVDDKLTLLTNEMHRKAEQVSVDSLRNELITLERNGTEQARTALKGVTDLTARVVTLEGKTATSTAIDTTTKQLAAQASNIRWIILGLVLNAAGILATLTVALFELVKHP